MEKEKQKMNLEHIRYLVETIGPRGSTTQKEREAAEYVRNSLKEVGIKPKVETFLSARSAWWPSSLGLGIALIASLLSWLGGRVLIVSIAISIIALFSLLLEISFIPNPLRWMLPKGKSQNVWAVIPPQGKVKRRIVLNAHMDSHRSPLVFSTAGWVKLFQTLIPVGLACIVLNLLIFSISLFFELPLLKILSSIPAIIMFFVFLLTLQADFTPYSTGANDDASGVSVVLNLASILKGNPLKNSEIILLFSGCEEVGSYGAVDFIKRHKNDLKKSPDGKDVEVYWITYDAVGGKGAKLTYLKTHTFFTTAKVDPELKKIVDTISLHKPDIAARAYSPRGAYTDGHIAYKAGFKIITFLNLKEDGTLPYWHQTSDTLEHLDTELMDKTEQLSLELLKTLDG